MRRLVCHVCREPFHVAEELCSTSEHVTCPRGHQVALRGAELNALERKLDTVLERLKEDERISQECETHTGNNWKRLDERLRRISKLASDNKRTLDRHTEAIELLGSALDKALEALDKVLEAITEEGAVTRQRVLDLERAVIDREGADE